MSIQAITWAMMLAPVPLDVDRKTSVATKPSATCRQVLAALAQHAGIDGRDAFPSVEKLMAYTNLSERTVRICLDRLEGMGVIVESTSGKVARVIKRKIYRPKSYDLQLGMVRSDLDDELLLELVERNAVLHDGLDLAPEVHLAHEREPRGASGARILTPDAPEPFLNRASSLKEKRQSRASSTPHGTPAPHGRRQGSRLVAASPPAHDLIADRIQQAIRTEQWRDDAASQEWIRKLTCSIGDGRQFVLEDWDASGRAAA